jgi:hypothetical protein
MRKLRDFQCTRCERVYERFVGDDVTDMVCECGDMAYPVIGMPTIRLDGTDPSFPGAYERWARIREDNAKIKAKRSYAEVSTC